MPDIKAFRAWRYNTQKIRDLSRVVAPPYDVISKAQQDKLYSYDPHNVIRLELGKKATRDNAIDNVYTRARAILQEWKAEGVLVREGRPALYVSAQDYVEEGKKKSRIGFFSAMRVDEGAVLKHENTLAGPKEDRLKLLKEVRTNLSPIFGLFEDKKALVQSQLRKTLKAHPLIDIRVAGVRHRLYLETRPAVIDAVSRVMKSKPMFIADGHHRFEVACQYKKWARSQGAGGASDYVLTYFSDVHHNPFKIFPTHRLIRSPKARVLAKALTGLGVLEKVRDLKAVLTRLERCREETRDKKYSFGFYSKREGFWLLTLDPAHSPGQKKSKTGGASPVDKLDVAVLHQKILEPRFSIHLSPAGGGSAIGGKRSEAIDFTRDAREAVDKVQSGGSDLAIFLRPTSLREMLLVSKKGLKMPQKSTYFYPKLLTGLVFHGLDS